MSKVVCNKMRVMESRAVGENRVEGVGQWACNAETCKERRREGGRKSAEMKEVTGICVIRGKEENSIFGAAHRLLSLSVPPHPTFLRWRPRLDLGPWFISMPFFVELPCVQVLRFPSYRPKTCMFG